MFPDGRNPVAAKTLREELAILVLGINIGERVRITVGTTEVWVEVTAVGTKRAKLGFVAPAEVVIDREYIARAKDQDELGRMLNDGKP